MLIPKVVGRSVDSIARLVYSLVVLHFRYRFVVVFGVVYN